MYHSAKDRARLAQSIGSLAHVRGGHWSSSWDREIARLVERPTERPGAIVTRVGGSSLRLRGGKGFFSLSQLSVQTLLRRLYNPRVQSYAINIWAHVKTKNKQTKKSQTLVAIPVFGRTKILHTLTMIVMGSAALAAAVPYPGKATRICSDGQ